MAAGLSNYAELQDFLIHMAWRKGDDEFAARLPTYIALGEERLNLMLAPTGLRWTLSDAQPTNWLLQNYPSLYVASTLVWGGIANLDPDMATAQKGILEEGIAEVLWRNAHENKAPLMVDPALVACDRFDITTG